MTEPWPLLGTLLSGELQAFLLVPTAIPNRKARSREVEEPPPMPSVRTWVSLFPLLLNILMLHGGRGVGGAGSLATARHSDTGYASWHR